MTARRAQVVEGCWHAVPLTHGFAAGLVVRGERGRFAIVSFADQLFGAAPTLERCSTFGPRDVVYSSRVDVEGIREGTWARIGQHPDWSRARWPVPVFATYLPVGRPWKLLALVTLDDDGDATQAVHPIKLGDPLPNPLPPADGYAPASAVEIILSQILCDGDASAASR